MAIRCSSTALSAPKLETAATSPASPFAQYRAEHGDRRVRDIGKAHIERVDLGRGEPRAGVDHVDMRRAGSAMPFRPDRRMAIGGRLVDFGVAAKGIVSIGGIKRNRRAQRHRTRSGA